MLYISGQPLWCRRINSVETFAEILDYTDKAAADSAAPLPSSLASRSFRWTGGGIGPEPPIAD